MADEFKFYADPKDDPGKNDDSQPSVTTPEQVLRMADERAGVKPSEAKIPAPADAIDLAYRTAIADVDAQEVGQTVAAASKAGAEPDVEALGEGEADTADTADTEDTGSGPFESRTHEQLKNAARVKGLAVSGSKDDLVERLRG
jgi:hypothetical protein